MKLKIGIVIFGMFILLFTGCNKEWDKHYDDYPETVDENVWDAIQKDPKLSKFVEIVKANKFDTLFNSDIPYSVLIPTNDAITNYTGVNEFSEVVLRYHFYSHLLNSSSIEGKRKVQTLTEKFAMFEKSGNSVKIDGVEVIEQSPLYRNGRYFVVDEVVDPNPNLYEYYAFTNPILSDYIDSQDTVILDKEKSKPLGFDEDGNTVYDTVSTIENQFEWKFFPVKHEFRTAAATIVFPKEEDYNNALTVMAQKLGGDYNDYNDIPLEWQTEVLMPHLLEQGVFLNMIEEEEFIWKSPTDTVKLLNALGDSVVITYVPTDQFLCSNGYAYNYEDFEIPDSLYNGGTKYEGEWLLEQTGVNRYSWYDFADMQSSIPLDPLKEKIARASNDSILRVPFPKGFDGSFSLEFKGPRLFPRKYRMEVRTHMDIGGIYDIYINGELARTFDYYDYVLYHGLIRSVTGKRFKPDKRFNMFDMWVNNITEYGKPNIKFVYRGPSTIMAQGLVIDYVEFIPVEE